MYKTSEEIYSFLLYITIADVSDRVPVEAVADHDPANSLIAVGAAVR